MRAIDTQLSMQEHRRIEDWWLAKIEAGAFEAPVLQLVIGCKIQRLPAEAAYGSPVPFGI